MCKKIRLYIFVILTINTFGLMTCGNIHSHDSPELSKQDLKI